jgi:L-alanine-DL-glutamate epimerase-like enolase superfamily enzyme
MKIARVEAFYLRFPLAQTQIHATIPSLRDLGTLLVRITLDNGLVGLGRTYGGDVFGSQTVKRCVETHFGPLLVGEDPTYVQRLWLKMQAASHFLGLAGVAFQAISALDIALWDLRAKAVGLPLYKLLGAARDSVGVYASEGWLNFSVDELAEACLKLQNQGYRGVKIRLPLDRDDCTRRMRAVREALGPEAMILVDVQNAWVNEPESVRRIGDIERYDPFLIEEPVRVLDLEGHAAIARAVPTPIAGGEHLYNRRQFKEALEKGAFNYVQADAVRVGGISEWMKIAAMCESWFVPVLPHAAYEIHLHTALAFGETSVPFIEFLTDYEGDLLPRIYKDFQPPINGVATPPAAPGLGVTFDEAGVREFMVDA